MKPRLLDLFCGAGGAAVGYHRAGFDVIGVDIAEQPHYPFAFYRDDAMALLRDEAWRWPDAYAAIHASPPCQGYTTMSNRHGSSAPLLITEVRDRLVATGLPYIIENVVGARRRMPGAITLHGAHFGLGVHRPRLFESNMLLMAPRQRRTRDAAAVYGREDRRLVWRRADGSELRAATLDEARTAMGIDWMDWPEIREAIPPAYTEYLGSQLLDHIGVTT